MNNVAEIKAIISVRNEIRRGLNRGEITYKDCAYRQLNRACNTYILQLVARGTHSAIELEML